MGWFRECRFYKWDPVDQSESQLQRNQPGKGRKGSNSVLNYFRKIVVLRKDHKVFTYGEYELLNKNNPDVYAYTRSGEGEKMLVVLNFSSQQATTNAGNHFDDMKLLLSNYATQLKDEKPANAITLRPMKPVFIQ